MVICQKIIWVYFWHPIHCQDKNKGAHTLWHQHDDYQMMISIPNDEDWNKLLKCNIVTLKLSVSWGRLLESMWTCGYCLLTMVMMTKGDVITDDNNGHDDKHDVDGNRWWHSGGNPHWSCSLRGSRAQKVAIWRLVTIFTLLAVDVMLIIRSNVHNVDNQVKRCDAGEHHGERRLPWQDPHHPGDTHVP